MTISFMAGRRIQGLDSDLTATQLPAGSVGGWVELGRTTLGEAGDTITVSSLADKRYYMVLMHDIPTGNTQWYPRLGYGSVDSGNNYSTRESYDGAASDTTVTSTSSLRWNTSVTTSYNTQKFGVAYIANYASKEKLSIFNGVAQNTAGATTAPSRAENVSKWAETTNPLNIVNLNNIEAGDYNTGSEVVVLGWDPADSHTNNFWEELADASWSSGGSISSGTFTAKKYLWIQGWHTNDSNATGYATLRVGNTTVDTGSNYANRYNQNASGEFIGTSENFAYIYGSNTNASSMTGFFNTFIINNASNEKLMINHYVARGASGAANAPDRWESVHKWANTSQINIVELLRSANNFTAGQIKVWGAD